MIQNMLKYLWLVPLLLVSSCSTDVKEEVVTESEAKPDRNMGGVGVPRGLIITTDGLTPGYVLYDVPNSALSYLISRSGEVLHEWKGNFSAINSYLTDRGTVVRQGPLSLRR